MKTPIREVEKARDGWRDRYVGLTVHQAIHELERDFANSDMTEREFKLTAALIRVFAADTLGDAVNIAWDTFDAKTRKMLEPKIS